MAKFSIKNRIKSFGYAINGAITYIKNEHNAWIHIFAILNVSVLGIYIGISSTEWISLVFCFGIVLMAEGFNSAIETLANKVTTEQDPQIKKTKDIAAGAVLVTAIMAAIIGCIIFIPYLIK